MFFSYLENRTQRVRIGTNHSSWLQLNGAMPQGSGLGPLTFLLLIDDLQADCLVHKYDTTLTELLQGRNESSNMQNFFQQVLNWSNINDIAVNFTKTKEMIMGPVLQLSLDTMGSWSNRTSIARVNCWDFI